MKAQQTVLSGCDTAALNLHCEDLSPLQDSKASQHACLAEENVVNIDDSYLQAIETYFSTSTLLLTPFLAICCRQCVVVHFQYAMRRGAALPFNDSNRSRAQSTTCSGKITSPLTDAEIPIKCKPHLIEKRV